MKKSTWDNIDPKIQGKIVANFEMAEINFERDHVLSRNDERQAIDSPWMTRDEAAEYARCSKDTIDNWIKAGHIKCSKTAEGRPGRILIDKASLEKFLRSKIVRAKKRIRKMAPSVPGGYRVQHKKN